MKIAALVTWPYSHYLDHLGPLCALLDIPLFTPDAEIYALQRYYPDLNLIYKPELQVSLLSFFADWDCLVITARFWKEELGTLMELLYGHRPRFLYCPHGLSEKGDRLTAVDPFLSQEAALIYGQSMQNRIQARKIPLRQVISCGNYRLHYYLKHQLFFDALVQKGVLAQFDQARPTMVYAPTWADSENTSSFAACADDFLKRWPKKYNLIIKFHPLLYEDHPEQVYPLIEQYKACKNLCFLQHFPLVYPILAVCAAYIGDGSSVGYDFLALQRPMFFLGTSPSRLGHCGLPCPNNFHLPQENRCLQAQKALYAESFDPFSLEKLSSEINTDVSNIHKCIQKLGI